VPCIGYYDVVGSAPDNAGQWGIIPMGFWAPTNQFVPTSLPSSRLPKASGSTSSGPRNMSARHGKGEGNDENNFIDDVSLCRRDASIEPCRHQNRMRSSDYISYKFSTYMRGSRLGDLFGRRHGDYLASLGAYRQREDNHRRSPFNYYNFQGEKHGLIPVDSFP